MPVQYHNLRRKVEAAFQGYLRNVTQDVSGSINHYRSMEQGDVGDVVAMPCIIVKGTGSRPMSPDLDATSGATNRYVSIDIEVRTPAAAQDDAGTVIADAGDRHDSIVGWIMDAIHTDDLIANLNNEHVEALTIEQVDLPVEQFSADGRAFVTRLTFDVLAVSKGII